MEQYLINMTHYLTDQSGQIAALFVSVSIACWVLRKASAHWRYLLWCIVLAKCLIPPFLTIPLALLPAQEVASDQAFSTSTAETTPLPMATYEPPTSEPAVAMEYIIPESTEITIGERLGAIGTRTWCGLGWLVGTSLYLFIALVKALRINRWLRRDRRTPEAQIQLELGELRNLLKTTARPKIWMLEGASHPFVWGWLRGDIYLPSRFAPTSTENVSRQILMHELAHIHRWDAAVNTLQIIAQAIFFFHPLIWWTNKKIRGEREKCSDEITIACLNAQPKEYSSAIVDSLVTEYESQIPIPSLAIAGPVKNIEDRIKTMMNPGKRFRHRPTWTAIITSMTLAAIALPTALILTVRAQTEEIPVVQSTDSGFMAELSNGVTVELIGICEHPSKDKQWWRPDGNVMKEQDRPYEQLLLSALTYPENMLRELVVRVKGPTTEDVGIISNLVVGGTFVKCNDDTWGNIIDVEKTAERADIYLGVATGPWERAAMSPAKDGPRPVFPGFAFTEAYDTNRGYGAVTITHKKNIHKENYRVIAFDKDGKIYPADSYGGHKIDGMRQTTVIFRYLKAGQMNLLEFQTRPYSWIAFKNVSLHPGHKTDVQVEIDSILVNDDNESRPDGDSPPSAEANIDIVIKQLRSERTRRELELQRLRLEVGPNHQKVLALQAQIADIDKTLEDVKKLEDLKKKTKVAQSRPNVVFISGDVKRPGAYDLPPERDFAIKNLIANAGLPDTDERLVALLRPTGKGRLKVVYSVHFSELLSGKKPDPPLQPGDILMVTKREGDPEDNKRAFLSDKAILERWENNYLNIKSSKVSFVRHCFNVEPPAGQEELKDMPVIWYHEDRIEAGQQYHTRVSLAKEGFENPKNIREDSFDGNNSMGYISGNRSGMIRKGMI